MSGAGSPELDVDGRGLRVTIVAGSWHDEITNGLIAGATRTLESAGASFELVRVPGSFELPVVSKAALEAGADAVVALGVIIRGGTPHFEYVSSAATPASPWASACSPSTTSSRASTERACPARRRTRAARPPRLRSRRRTSCAVCAADSRTDRRERVCHPTFD